MNALDDARRIVEECDRSSVRPTPPTTVVSDDFEHLRWFPLPHEVTAG